MVKITNEAHKIHDASSQCQPSPDVLGACVNVLFDIFDAVLYSMV